MKSYAKLVAIEDSLTEKDHLKNTENLKKLPSGKRKPGKLLEVVPDGKYTLTKQLKIGEVKKIIILKSNSNTIHDKSLSELAKQRIEARGNPSSMKYNTLEDFLSIRTSCWLDKQVCFLLLMTFPMLLWPT